MNAHERFTANWHLAWYPQDWTFLELLDFVRNHLNEIHNDNVIRPTDAFSTWDGHMLATSMRVFLLDLNSKFIAKGQQHDR